MKKKIAFIVRGNLNKPNKFRSFVTKYFQDDFDVYLHFTRRKGHAIDIVEKLLVDQYVDYIVGVGGDGTFNEVVNGYMKAPVELRDKVVLITFPRGAGNDFARSVGRIESMEHLNEVVRRGKTQKLDLVEVRFLEDNKQVTRYYNNSFDIGLGGLVCQLVNKSGKSFGSNITYFVNIIRSFLLFKRIPIEITSPNYNFIGKVLVASFNNGRYFGSGLNIAPDARIDDGMVNVVIARNINMLQFLRHVPSLRKGKKINIPELTYNELSECIIESPNTDCPIEFDGEVLGALPMRLKVRKHAATILKL